MSQNRPKRAVIEFNAEFSAYMVTALFFAASVAVSIRRLFWFDEVFTTFSTRSPDWSSMWRALAAARDPMPFGYFAVARIFDRLLGPHEIGIRLPSAIAVAIGLMVTFYCVRHLADGIHGVLAIAFLLCSFLPFYASEGRAYGILFLCAALSFWFWLRSSVWFFGIVMLIGVLIHYYMIFCLVPFAAMELLQWRPWKLPSRKLIVGIGGAVLALLILFPQIVANHREYGTSFWAAPGKAAFVNAYEQMFPYLTFLLCLMAICFAVLAFGKRDVPPMNEGERTAWLFYLIPPVALLCALVVTHAFWPRYLIGTLPGAAVAFAVAMHRMFGREALMTSAVLLIFLGFGAWRLLYTVRHVDQIESYGFGSYQAETREILGHEAEFWNDGKKIIVPPFLLDLPSRYYSQHPERYFLVFPEHRPSFTLVPGLTLDAVVQNAREIAFVDPGFGLLAMLSRAKLNLRMRQSGPITIVYAE